MWTVSRTSRPECLRHDHRTRRDASNADISEVIGIFHDEFGEIDTSHRKLAHRGMRPLPGAHRSAVLSERV